MCENRGDLKNRKLILQTKVQKTAKLTNRKVNHGLRNNTEGTVLGRKKANLFANLLTISKNNNRIRDEV